MSTSVSSFGSLRQLPVAAPPPSRIDARGWCSAPRSRDLTAQSMRLRAAGSRGASSRASCRKVPKARCVERGRANPVCQRAPEFHLDGPLAGLPGAREQLASRRAARFGRPGRVMEPASSSGFVLARAASDDPGAHAAVAPCGGHPLPSPKSASCGARVNGSALHGFGAPSAGGLCAFARHPAGCLPNRDETRARPRVSSDPARRARLAPSDG